MNFIGLFSLLLSLHFHFVEPGPVTDAEKFGSFVKKLKQHRFIAGITHDHLEYDENLIQAVRNVEPKCVTQDITVSDEWSQIVSKLRSQGFAIFQGKSTRRRDNYQKGKVDMEFYDNLMAENIEKDATEWKYDGRYDKLAVILYVNTQPNVNTRFLVIFKVLTMGDYVLRHVRSLRGELKVNSNALARISNKRLNIMAQDYYAKTFLRTCTTDDLALTKSNNMGDIKALNLTLLEIEIQNPKKLPIPSRVLEYLDSLAKGKESKNEKNIRETLIFSKEAQEMGVYIHIMNATTTINGVILVQMVDK